jgi:PAS domain-containing protein
MLDQGVIQLDPEGTILIYNRAESRFSGRTPERVIGPSSGRRDPTGTG